MFSLLFTLRYPYILPLNCHPSTQHLTAQHSARERQCDWTWIKRIEICVHTVAVHVWKGLRSVWNHLPAKMYPHDESTEMANSILCTDIYMIKTDRWRICSWLVMTTVTLPHKHTHAIYADVCSCSTDESMDVTFCLCVQEGHLWCYIFFAWDFS